MPWCVLGRRGVRWPSGLLPALGGGQKALPEVTACLPAFSAGVVTLLSHYEVCKEGDRLTPEQARILVSRLAPPSGLQAVAAGATEGSRPLLLTPSSFVSPEAFRV